MCVTQPTKSPEYVQILRLFFLSDFSYFHADSTDLEQSGLFDNALTPKNYTLIQIVIGICFE